MAGIYGTSAEDRHFERLLNQYLFDAEDVEDEAAKAERDMAQAEDKYERRRDDAMMEEFNER